MCGRRILFLSLRTRGVVSKHTGPGSSAGQAAAQTSLRLNRGAGFGEGLGTSWLPVISDELTLHKCHLFLILGSLSSYKCHYGKLRVWE